MPQITNAHLEAVPGAELRHFGYRKVADAAARLALTDQVVGEIVTQTDTGRSYQWTGTEWHIWTTDGTVTRENITGAATLDVTGHAAAELTLTGSVTGLTLTGWDTDNTLYQRVRVQILQDATGGRTFDWSQVNGTWVETPPATLESTPTTTSLQFYAITTDGGTSVWLEPIGIAYSMDCVYAQVVEVAIPAVAANGSATVTHSFQMVGSVDLIDVATGRRVIADWRQVTPGVASSNIEIDYTFAVAAGEQVARVVGLAAQPCELTVTASEWETLVLSVAGAGTVSPRLDFTGPAGSVEWVWGDGSAPEVATSGSPTAHTYGAAYSGPVTIRYRRGTQFTRFDSPNDSWDFNISALSELTDLTYLRFDGSPALTGDVAALAGMTSLTHVLIYNTAVNGDIATFAGMPGLRQLWAFSTGVAGNIATLATLPVLDFIFLNNTTVSGDIGALAANTGLQRIQVSDSSVSGSIDALAAVTSLAQLRASNTAVNGDVSNLAGLTSLTAVQLSSTGVNGDIATLGTLTSLAVLELQNATVSGAVDGLAPLTLLAELQLNNTTVTGDPSLVAAAAVAQLSTFSYVFVGVLPTAPQLDAVLASLAAGTVNNGTLSIGGTNPAITNTAAVTTLQGRGWTVTHN